MSRTRKIIAATAAAIALSIGSLGMGFGTTAITVPMEHNWCC